MVRKKKLWCFGFVFAFCFINDSVTDFFFKLFEKWFFWCCCYPDVDVTNWKPVDASEQPSALKQRVLKKEACRGSLKVLFVFFSPLTPSCITQLLEKCIHPCLGKQTLSSLGCHQKSLEDKSTFSPKTRCARSKPAYWKDKKTTSERVTSRAAPAIPPTKTGGCHLGL